ncbi:hypothetical protein MPH_04417 [Macrophomina phaseolina MS6]|uniref:Xylanolytic transcriptional activator regulatory domain-containing protein n=1 Tax=Macrophomina phaseolina (strain MS6) TaxID=1126212 RepID=K2SNE9_MACPH|nr:hypothetical protein MPH_04417 [Macrophomina phaseolina MS6]
MRPLKDKTMVFMLDALQRIEGKIDLIGKAVDPESGVYEPGPYTTPHSGRVSSISSGAFMIQDRLLRDQERPASQKIPTQSSPRLVQPQGHRNAHAHVTPPHKVLLWPFIHSRLAEFQVEVAEDLQSLRQEGTPWFLRHEVLKHPDPLPANARLETEPVDDPSIPDSDSRVRFPTLTHEEMRTYAHHYFNTFNMLYLILDRRHFMEVVLPKVARYGFGDGDHESVIALLVFSLGKVALDGTWSPPLDNGMHFESGLRGGTLEEPPALDIFNEARRRTGFISYHCSIESIQIQLLSAMYYESCGRHLDFWRAAQSASTAFQILIKCAPIDWFTERGNLVKRLYWTCNLIENWYHFDLDLPRTAMCDHEDEVPLPGELLGQSTEEDQQTVMHFLAMIALRRLVTRVHKTIFEASSSSSEFPEGYDGPPTHVIRELSRQLESWRSMLPQSLQWADDPSESRFHYSYIDSTKTTRLFTPDVSRIPVDQPNALDLVTAQLRSRYYYTRFIMYRPFVYKVLHWPELTTDEDRQLAGLCIKSALMWPIALAPPKNRKRLVPYLFAWTQNFIGILLILRVTTISNILADVCRSTIDQTELMLTVQYLLEWIADVRPIDGIATWSWKILVPLFRDVFPDISGADA